MRKTKLANTGIEVPPVMLGGNVFGWTVNEADSLRILDAALDLGLNFIDTADIYSRWAPGHTGGESETILGKWLASDGKRSRVVLATKVGMDMGDGKTGLSAAYIAKAAEDSMRRLQTDYIDLYQSHQDDAKTPIEETLGAFERLMKAGKVRSIGASNYSGARLREAMETSVLTGLPRYATLQPHYNLMERAQYETDLAPVVAAYALAVIPYFSLASGFLTGKYRSAADAQGKARGGGVSKYMNTRGWAVLRALDEVAGEYHATPARVALAWLRAQPGVAAPIASVTSVAQLTDLVAATELTLDEASIAKLNVASSTAAEAAKG